MMSDVGLSDTDRSHLDRCMVYVCTVRAFQSRITVTSHFTRLHTENQSSIYYRIEPAPRCTHNAETLTSLNKRDGLLSEPDVVRRQLSVLSLL